MARVLEPPGLLAGEIDDDQVLPAVAVEVLGPVHERVAVGLDVELLGFSVMTCIVHGERLGLAARAPSLRVGWPGFSYQTLPAEISSRPSLLKSPMPTPSLRKARSSVVF